MQCGGCFVGGQALVCSRFWRVFNAYYGMFLVVVVKGFSCNVGVILFLLILP